MNEAQHKTANMRFYVAFIRFVHVCHICAGALVGEKKIYESWELELHAVVSHLILLLGTVLWKKSLNHLAISPAPYLLCLQTCYR